MSRVLDGMREPRIPPIPETFAWASARELPLVGDSTRPGAPRPMPFAFAAVTVALVGALVGFTAARCVTFTRSLQVAHVDEAPGTAQTTAPSRRGRSSRIERMANAAPDATAAKTRVTGKHGAAESRAGSAQVASPAVEPALEASTPAAVVTQPDEVVTFAAAMPAPADLPDVALPADPPDRAPAMVDGGASVTVSGDQLVSVSGTANSLRSLVEEICRQSGIELRAYKAPDRRYVGHLEDVPLTEAFRSILLSESYFLGLRAREHTDAKRMTWLKVLPGTAPATGNDAPSHAAPPTLVTAAESTQKAPSPPTEHFVLPSTLLFQAFGTKDAERREQALIEVLQRLAEPARRSQFLATDSGEIAKTVARYGQSAQSIRRLREMTNEPDLQAKLGEVLNLVGN